ncbi:rod shape-determining protein [Mesoplasma melaleucae]|uniref:rod shape-determining protein n=1 Tax=Mesoplasma melaleucae TaxID=81459 RepID=UPI0004823646|nr:rod shape-determining protein [Mesoplasma melaleucae]
MLCLTFAPRVILSALGANAEINDEHGFLILDINQDYAKVALTLIVEGKIVNDKENMYAKKFLDDSLNKYMREEH